MQSDKKATGRTGPSLFLCATAKYDFRGEPQGSAVNGQFLFSASILISRGPCSEAATQSHSVRTGAAAVLRARGRNSGICHLPDIRRPSPLPFSHLNPRDSFAPCSSDLSAFECITSAASCAFSNATKA